MSIKVLESNVVASFDRVRSDILRLNDELTKLRNEVSRMQDTQGRTTEKILNVAEKLVGIEKNMEKRARVAMPKQVEKQVIVKVVGAKKHSKFIASKSGKKFHVENCIFAKNIKPKYKKVFKSRAKALNQGLKPCTCISK